MKHLTRKVITLSFFVTLLCGVFAFGGGKNVTSVRADSSADYPGSGYSGGTIFVNGRGTYFASGQADLAVCFWDNNSSAYAWTDRISKRVYGDYLRVTIPWYQGQSKQWNRFKVCRYNPGMNPTTDGDYGVYNSTDAIDFSFYQGQNVIEITGYDNDKLTYTRNHFTQYGVKAERHMYLDLSNFTRWEEDNAKFAIWFASSSNAGGDSWSQSYATGSLVPSFCWKVEGQSNDHLYECVVPNTGSESNPNIWSMVIAVRIDPIAGEPNWDNQWNKTPDLIYNQGNNALNVITISDWGAGSLTREITTEERLGYFGNYFLDTVKCSGTGNSDVTTSAQWNAVKTAYGHLSRVLQGKVWTTVADKTGSLIAQAMARYDYIILYKKYDHEDFINRAGSPNKTVYENPYMDLLSENNDSSMMIIILSISLINVAALATLLVLKKKRHK